LGGGTKNIKIQNIYQDIFQLVDSVSTTKMSKNSVETYEIRISLTGDDNFKAHSLGA